MQLFYISTKEIALKNLIKALIYVKFYNLFEQRNM